MMSSSTTLIPPPRRAASHRPASMCANSSREAWRATNKAPARVARIHGESDFAAAVVGAFWVIEAITENLAMKQELFRKLESEAGRDVILTSNTSGLRISDIVRDVTTRDRTATTHFWFPGHLVPLVEIVMGEGTDFAVAERLRRSCSAGAKRPSLCGGIFRGS